MCDFVKGPCDIKSSKISTAYDVWFSRYRPSNMMLAMNSALELAFINFLWAVYMYGWTFYICMHLSIYTADLDGYVNKNVTSRFDSPSALNLTGAVHCVKCENIIFHLHSFIQLLWRHMNVKASQTTSNSAICSTNYPGSQQYNQSSTLLAISEGNPLMTGGFPSQMASNAQSISWPHHTLHCLVWHFFRMMHIAYRMSRLLYNYKTKYSWRMRTSKTIPSEKMATLPIPIRIWNTNTPPHRNRKKVTLPGYCHRFNSWGRTSRAVPLRTVLVASGTWPPICSIVSY